MWTRINGWGRLEKMNLNFCHCESEVFTWMVSQEQEMPIVCVIEVFITVYASIVWRVTISKLCAKSCTVYGAGISLCRSDRKVVDTAYRVFRKYNL